MENNDIELHKYMIMMRSPTRAINKGSIPFETDEYGDGEVIIYKVLGYIPSRKDSIGHMDYVGGFQLKPKKDKTAKEFIDEINEGLIKFISKDK